MAAGLLNAVKAMPAVQRAAPVLAGGARIVGKAGGPLAAAGMAYDAYQMGRALEETQDPVEQLRFIYEQQGSQPLKIGRGGLSRGAMEAMMAENPNAVFDAIDQGILDPSVGTQLQGPVERPTENGDRLNMDNTTLTGDAPSAGNNEQGGVPAKRSAGGSEDTTSTARPKRRMVLDEIAITAEAPKKPRSKDSDSNILRAGARGANVAEVQKKLSALGSLTPGVEFDLGETGADGIYGDKTVAAVKEFQNISGIKADGVVGPETRDALDKALGSVSDARSPEILAKTEAAPTRSVKTSPVRFNMSEFSDENIDEAVGDPIAPPQIASDRDAPTENTQAYLDLGLDVRPSAFPLFRGRRNRRNRK